MKKAMSEKTKQKISKSLKGRKGRIWTKEQRESSSKRQETWSEKDLLFLKQNYDIVHWKELCDHFNISRQQITTKANKLNLKKSQHMMHISKGEHSIGKSWGNHTEKHKNHMKKIMEDKLNKGFKMPGCNIGCKNSKIEQTFNTILKEMDLKLNKDYYRNKAIKTIKTVRYPDFLIGTLIFEIDGEYWHKDKHYDYERDKELNELGFKVIHFTGTQIKREKKWVELETKKCLYLQEMKMVN